MDKVKIIPSQYENKEWATSGEKKSFGLLKTVLKRKKPTSVIWHSPVLPPRGKKSRYPGSLNPDIIVYVSQFLKAHGGIVVYEVKDWTINRVGLTDPETWTIQFGDERKKGIPNPLNQAKRYADNFRGEVDRFSTIDVRNLPIVPAVIFPNIKEDEFANRNLKGLSASQCLFKDHFYDDFNVESRIREHFEAWGQVFGKGLSTEQLNEVSSIIFPQDNDKSGKLKNIFDRQDLDEIQNCKSEDKVVQTVKILQVVKETGLSEKEIRAKAREYGSTYAENTPSVELDITEKIKKEVKRAARLKVADTVSIVENQIRMNELATELGIRKKDLRDMVGEFFGKNLRPSSYLDSDEVLRIKAHFRKKTEYIGRKAEEDSNA